MLVKHIFPFLLCVNLLISCNTNDGQQITYRGIYADEPSGVHGLYNPERGFRLETAVDVNQQNDVWKPERYTGITDNLEAESLKYASDSVTLVQSYFYLHGFVGKELSQEAFATMDVYFNRLRELGKKSVLRFAYETDFMGRASSGPTLEDVLLHMEQLKPFLAANTDVIQVVQAGFIGAWGEWHGSLHGLEHSTKTKRTILEKIIWMTPDNRMVQVRIPEYKNLLDKGSAAYQRTSFHDDFIIIEPHKWDGDMHEGTSNFAQIVKESPYVVVDGELPWGSWSVNKDKDNPEAGWMIDGIKVARQLFLHHYTSLSLIHNYKEGDHPEKFSMMYWKETALDENFLQANNMPVSADYFTRKDGSKAERNVFDYIRDHLGYRLELQQLNIANKPAAGNSTSITLTLKNRGFSTLYNEHPVYFVLIDENEQVLEFLTDANANDFQPYMPEDVSCTPLLHRVQSTITTPAGTVSGKYKLGLWLPDGSDRLKYKHRYAIRCANGDTDWWVSENGKYGVNILAKIEL